MAIFIYAEAQNYKQYGIFNVEKHDDGVVSKLFDIRDWAALVGINRTRSYRESGQLVFMKPDPRNLGIVSSIRVYDEKELQKIYFSCRFAPSIDQNLKTTKEHILNSNKFWKVK